MFHVKHLDRKPSMATLTDFVTAAMHRGLSLHSSQQQALELLVQWLATKAPRVGLSKYNTPALVWEQAIAPVLTVYDIIDMSTVSTCADLGTGAGAVGLTLAILQPDLPIDLVDRRQRAADFVQLLSRRLDLSNVKVICAQIHELREHRANGYEMVVMRALASAETALSLGLVVVQKGGYIAAWHQCGDTGYGKPGSEVEVVGTRGTAVPGLQVSVYRRVG